MMTSWWFLWMAFMFLCLAPPIGYGWGYRGWGPPYPSYVQRLRSERATAMGGMVTYDHRAWGWGGDVMWIVLLVGIFWAFSGIWWR
jgi:hypothetical protein